ncbi:hypothetical protein B484DRAFT_403286 [Ochromonadaceae sp. CCMP2298]|nr:hypothetical protein B484DRAFT_403286 [Ochromonadaceae sp. CCMP2298]
MASKPSGKGKRSPKSQDKESPKSKGKASDLFGSGSGSEDPFGSDGSDKVKGEAPREGAEGSALDARDAFSAPPAPESSAAAAAAVPPPATVAPEDPSAQAKAGVAAPAVEVVEAVEEVDFSTGDIVWAQTDVHFPFWPAYVIDPLHLPAELKAAHSMITSTSVGAGVGCVEEVGVTATGAVTGAVTGVAEGTVRRRKLPVYFYGRSDYDLVSPTSMRTYRPHRASLKGQDISGSLYVAFRRGIR